MSDLRLQIVMSAIDKLTRPLKDARTSSKELAASVKQTSDALKQLEQTGAKLENFKKLQADNQKLGDRLNYARQRMSLLKNELGAMGPPTQRQIVALEKQRLSIERLTEREGKLQRQTALVRGELYRAGISANDAATATARIARETAQYNQRLAEQQDRLKRAGEQQAKLNAIQGQYKKTMATRDKLAGTGVTLTATGGATLMALHKPVDEAAQYNHEMMSFQALGVGDSTLKEADKFARGMHVIGSSTTENLKTLKEAHSVLRDFEEAKMVTPELERLQFSTKFMARNGISKDAAEQLGDQAPAVLKIAELRNEINSPEAFKNSLNKTVQAFAASGGMVTPENYLAMLKTGGISAKQMNPQAYYFSMSHIIQQNGGERTGTQLASAYQNMMMGHITQGAAEEQMKLGLLNRNDVEYGSTGHIKKVRPGALVNNSLYMQDPFSYLMQEIVPRIQKKTPGLNEQQMELAIAKLFSNRNGADLFVTMYREQANMRKQITAGNQAYTIEQLVNQGKNSAQGQDIELEARKHDLYLQMGKDILPLYVKALEKTSAAIHKMTTFMIAHPEATKRIMEGAVAFGVLATAAGGAMLALAGILGPMAIIRRSMQTLGVEGLSSIISGLGRGVMWLVRSPFGMLRSALVFIGEAVGALSLPVTLVVAALAAVGLVIRKYWQPITVFLGGVVDGFKAAAAPIMAALAPLQPLFDWIMGSVKGLWDWFMKLLEPVKLTSDQLDSTASVGKKCGQFIAEGIALALQPLSLLREGITWLLEKLDLINSKSKSVPGMTAAPVTPALSGGAGAPIAWSPRPYGIPMFDSGGYLPAGRMGIVGENGPELINGPANILSRRRTAALAATMLMGATLPAAARPLHPHSLPATEYAATRQVAATAAAQSSMAAGPVVINIYPQSGQSATDIAREVARQLEAHNRRQQARQRSSFRDQGGLNE
ncbi:hypothetical protein NLN82_24105 [Citrobacter portucalensis]|uniref:phage tail tape measure protein n=1 Tax=Citrobacter portucalensis TaxID=1639133 RepID=UPI00226B6B24|nr:hypothetical protein [Citrobacter portucalensis]MCX9039104.1 hypothetical protein [Citrobacter portucalensis]